MSNYAVKLFGVHNGDFYNNPKCNVEAPPNDFCDFCVSGRSYRCQVELDEVLVGIPRFDAPSLQVTATVEFTNDGDVRLRLE